MVEDALSSQPLTPSPPLQLVTCSFNKSPFHQFKHLQSQSSHQFRLNRSQNQFLHPSSPGPCLPRRRVVSDPSSPSSPFKHQAIRPPQIDSLSRTAITLPCAAVHSSPEACAGRPPPVSPRALRGLSLQFSLTFNLSFIFIIYLNNCYVYLTI